MHAAAIDNGSRAHARAITREYLAQVGQPHIGAVFRDQLGDAQPPTALAFRARHVEHRQLAGDIAERDGAAAADFQPGLYDSKIVRLARLMFAIKSSVFGLASGW